MYSLAVLHTHSWQLTSVITLIFQNIIIVNLHQHNSQLRLVSWRPLQGLWDLTLANVKLVPSQVKQKLN